MCANFGGPLSVEKDSLKEATCELIAQAKLTNQLLNTLLQRLGPNPATETYHLTPSPIDEADF